jgi:hypothetical protein
MNKTIDDLSIKAGDIASANINASKKIVEK